MKIVVQFITLCMLIGFVNGQGVSQKLALAIKMLEDDSQMQSAILGFQVTDQKTGSVIFNKNSQVGLAIASSQKVITSVAALELLGSAYRYRTELAYDGRIANGILAGNLFWWVLAIPLSAVGGMIIRRSS
jgi:D-alanyl-D-alanine carboxypeptidase/D-alanyl-D-alanine-endopeptidase (penicillin-binding protein 4)